MLLFSFSLYAEEARTLLNHYAFEGHERVLEIGCGEGTLTAEIAQQVPDGFVLGMDSSPENILLAEQTYDPDLFANLQFQLGDATTLSLEEQFDLIVSCTVLDEENLEGMARALRSGGRVCLLPPDIPPEALEEALRAVGLKPLRLDTLCVEAIKP